MKTFLKSVLLGICCAASWQAHAASACVSKTVTLMVPYPAGALSDSIARHVGNALSDELGQQVLVENLAGAGGSLAGNKVLSRPADGHTLFLGSPNEVILAPLAMKAVKLRPEQFRLITPVTYNPMVLLTRKELPVANVDELIAYARNPDHKPLSYGSVGIGTLYHLAGEDLAARTKTKMLHIPYKGGAPLLQDMGGGLLDFAILPWATMYRGLEEQGRLKVLGVAADERDSLLPNLPAFGEGKVVKGYEYSIWAGLMVRKETPAKTLACLHEALAATLGRPDVKKALESTGSKPAEPLSLAASARLFAEQAARFQALAKRIGLQPQ